MKDTLSRISKHQAYWESKLHPLDPEQEHSIKVKLGHLSCEALERDGQLVLFEEAM